jgi:ubiquinone/menaquinone biosynthesis C-methylase UbiE
MRYKDSLYDAFMYPLEVVALRAIRRRIIPRASGRVLEIGVGTGANLPHYRWAQISELHALDVSLEFSVSEYRPMSRDAALIAFHEAGAEALPFPDAYFNTVVFTMVFCSVGDQPQGLSEVRRVIRPGGTLIFAEHVRPSARMLGAATDVLNPIWHATTGECNINRDTVAGIAQAGFEFHNLWRSHKGFLAHGFATAV